MHRLYFEQILTRICVYFSGDFPNALTHYEKGITNLEEVSFV